ncbi:hypothetical protein [Streptomyces sp. NPDC096033]|uniref:hypothetical protein n=1 Tax=Streptomyces sp. NPDC096033 TaxID=3366071 RepID=UPI00381E79F7
MQDRWPDLVAAAEVQLLIRGNTYDGLACLDRNLIAQPIRGVIREAAVLGQGAKTE